MNIEHDVDYEYRLKPRTITINGKEYNAPMNVAPEIGSQYWVCDFNCSGGFEPKSITWDGDSSDCGILELCNAFSTKDDCRAVCDAFNAILSGT